MTLNLNNKLSAFALAATMTVSVLSGARADTRKDHDIVSRILDCTRALPTPTSVGKAKDFIIALVPDGKKDFLAIMDLHPETDNPSGIVKRMPNGSLKSFKEMPALTEDQLSSYEQLAVNLTRDCIIEATGYRWFPISAAKQSPNP